LDAVQEEEKTGENVAEEGTSKASPRQRYYMGNAPASLFCPAPTTANFLIVIMN